MNVISHGSTASKAEMVDAQTVESTLKTCSTRVVWSVKWSVKSKCSACSRLSYENALLAECDGDHKQ
jgi:hypothetical protein